MARLVSAKCPNCGGNVRIDPKLDYVTCQFCGTSAFIEGRTHTPPLPNQPVFRVEPAAKTGWSVVLIPILLALVGGVIAFVNVYARSGSGSLGGGQRIVAGWAQPMVGDTNGDGVQEVISWLHLIRGSSVGVAIGAFDGRNGKELWRTEQLGLAEAQPDMAAAVIGNRLLLADADGKLHGRDLATGKLAWTQSLGERADHFCQHDGIVEVVVKDGNHRWFDVQTGKPSADPEPKPVGTPPGTDADAEANGGQRWCERPPSDERGFPAGVDRMSWSDEELRLHPLPKIEAMGAYTVLRRQSGPRLVLGNRETGTRVPMVAAVEGDRVLWSMEVPPSDPLSVEEGAPEIATLVGGRVFVVYKQRAPKGSRLTAISLKSGKRLWDVALPLGEGESPYQIQTSKRFVFVTDRTSIVAVSIAKGAVRYTVK